MGIGSCCCLNAQVKIEGRVRDANTGEPIFSANVVVKGTTKGVTTDFDGEFEIRTDQLPATLQISFIGYTPKEQVVSSVDKPLDVLLTADQILIEEAEIIGERISEKQKQAPLTVETMDAIAIKEAPSGNFYEGLGNLKGVDMTSASLGFKVINTRGFNSTSPVRSLQLIDGVDNQSPGLNFSLGNFLGASDLDVKSVEIVAGASSAFYGPGAFNGVINMETKNPFIFPGFSVSFKAGERSLFEQAIRYAEVVENKKGEGLLGWKLNFYSMQAQDWEADNYNPVDGSRVDANNPGRFDAVNIYGDEYYTANDFSTAAPWNFPALGIFYRTGYRETDLVDYNTNNLKANLAFHLRTQPEKNFDSPELIYAFNIGKGTTVYQGDNRFSLRDIVFWQNRIEYRKAGKFFIRAYTTQEDAGNSYDPYRTALQLLEQTRDPNDWAQTYVQYWNDSIRDRIETLGYPQLEVNPNPPPFFTFDYDSLDVWLDTYQDSIAYWHSLAETWTNTGNANIPAVDTLGYLVPGTAAFNTLFNTLVTSKNNELEGGTRFFDRSSLAHVHGEYIIEPGFLDEIRIGANFRRYTPDSDGTIFSDTAGIRIVNQEWGSYIGIQQKLNEDKFILSGTVRVDKNQNFDMVVSPAASVVVKPREQDFLRVSFSSALRNPTLADQYLSLDVGPAILSGNLNGVDSLITLESFSDYRNSLNTDTLRYFDIDPIRPEQVQTIEAGYRTTLGEKVYVDAGYYFSRYKNFIGFNIGIDAEFGDTGLPTDLQVFRYSANSKSTVTTQGFNIGVNYYIDNNFMLAGNYSWNQLVSADEDDPIIPAFNTPEHKFNISFSARDLESRWGRGNKWGFGVNYKWVEGVLFEGSPQFTGFVPTYDLVDAQANYFVESISTTFKFGASNVLNNEVIQVYGGPTVGRLAYFSILMEIN